MAMWNPFRGCMKYSDGCKYCYIHKGDSRRNVDTSKIEVTNELYKPIEKNKQGEYKIKSGIVYLCFNSDFLIEQADEYRQVCLDIIKERSDLTFLFLTKRIERFEKCMPKNFGEEYSNVIVCCTVENQEAVDKRLPIFTR